MKLITSLTYLNMFENTSVREFELRASSSISQDMIIDCCSYYCNADFTNDVKIV